jgi:hypothetical protein
VAAAVAVVAAAAGVVAGLFMIRGTPSAIAVAGSAPGVSASASVRAPASASVRAPASASARPARLQVAITGRVLAVSRTSITIGGVGPSVTAAVTGATTVTGRAHGIGGVKAGDEVSAWLAGTADELTATTIQDLADALSGQLAGTVRMSSAGRPAAETRAFLMAASTRSGSRLI